MQPSPSALRRPAYTGSDRCWPCTVANLAILALVAGALWLVAPVAGAAVALAGAVAIWLRGYLVPHTPRFAPRLAARLPRDPFHVAATDGGTDDRGPPASGGRSIAESDQPEGENGGATAAGEQVLATLAESGVVTADGDAVALDSDVEAQWHAAMADLRAAPDDDLAAATLAVAPTAKDVDVVTVRDTTYVVLSDGTDDVAGESWLRRPVAIAETAAAQVLDDAGVPADERPAGAAAMRLFLEACPACENDLVERSAGGCCGPPRRGPDGDLLRALVCESCETQVATFE